MTWATVVGLPGYHPAHRAPLHRSDRHEDSCSLVCEAAIEGAGNCTTYAGRHRRPTDIAELFAILAPPYARRMDALVLGEQP